MWLCPVHDLSWLTVQLRTCLTVCLCVFPLLVGHRQSMNLGVSKWITTQESFIWTQSEIIIQITQSLSTMGLALRKGVWWGCCWFSIKFNMYQSLIVFLTIITLRNHRYIKIIHLLLATYDASFGTTLLLDYSIFQWWKQAALAKPTNLHLAKWKQSSWWQNSIVSILTSEPQVSSTTTSWC